MNRAIEISAQGMQALALRQEVISNNLANADTAGFKSDILCFKAFPSVFSKAIGETKAGVSIDSVASRFKQGALINTGDKFDLALEGAGFFAVQTPDGTKYTRSGDFVLDDNGRLCSQQGFAVLGEGGAINILGQDVEINSIGEIIVDGALVNKVKVVDFANPNALKKYGNCLFEPVDENVSVQPASADTKVVSGFVESSGVNMMQEMVQMLETLRTYQTLSRVVLAQDEVQNKTVNQVGKAR